MTLLRTTVPLVAGIVVEGEGLRPLDPAFVAVIAESMKLVGLLNPITVVRKAGVPHLVAGRHRLAAAQMLGWETIKAHELAGDGRDIDVQLDAELAELDENLIRRDLKPAKRAAYMARAHELYEIMRERQRAAVKAEKAAAKARPIPRQLGAKNTRGRPVGSTSSAASATAKATGKSKRVVQRDAQRAQALGPEAVAKVSGTSLDKGVELDALTKLPPEERAPLIERAKAGEKVSARRPPKAQTEPPASLALQRLKAAWVAASEAEQAEFDRWRAAGGSDDLRKAG